MISGTTRKSGPYTGNGVQTSFPITFDFFSDDSLIRVKEKVIADDDDFGTVLVNPTSYTVVGSNVIAVAAPASTKQWLIELNMPQLQEYDYIDGGVFPQSDHETNLDRITRTLQQISQDCDRAPKTTPFGGATNLKLAPPEAGMLIGGNEDEDGFSPLISVGDIQAAQQYASDAESAMEAAVAARNAAQDAETNAETAETAAEASAAAAAASAASAAAAAAAAAGTPITETPAGLVNGANTVFTTSETPISGTLILILGNFVLVEGIHFSRAGDSCDLSGGSAPVGAPAADQPVYAIYRYVP